MHRVENSVLFVLTFRFSEIYRYVYRGQTPVYVVARCEFRVARSRGAIMRRRFGIRIIYRICRARRNNRGAWLVVSVPRFKASHLPLEGKGDRLRWMSCVALTAHYTIVRRYTLYNCRAQHPKLHSPLSTLQTPTNRTLRIQGSDPCIRYQLCTMPYALYTEHAAGLITYFS